MRSLGLDIGDKRIGIAMSDPGGILASPHSIMERVGDSQDIDTIMQIITKYDVKKIIVGLPLSLNGQIGEQALKVQAFVEHLIQHIDTPIEFRDERMTTVSARKLIQESRKRKLKQKAPDDAAAAAVILQSYLDEIANLAEINFGKEDYQAE